MYLRKQSPTARTKNKIVMELRGGVSQENQDLLLDFHLNVSESQLS